MNEIFKWAMEHPDQVIYSLGIGWAVLTKMYDFFKDLSFKNLSPKLFNLTKDLAEEGIKLYGSWDKIPTEIKNEYKNKALDFAIEKFPIQAVKPILMQTKDIPTSTISMYVESILRLATKPYVTTNGDGNGTNK